MTISDRRTRSGSRGLLAGVSWTTLATVASRGLTWLITLAVARELGPSALALMSLAWIAYSAVFFVRDQTIGSTVVYGEATPEAHGTLNLMSVASSGLLGAGLVAMAPLFSAATGRDSLVVLSLFGSAVVLSGLGAVAYGLLLRQMRFRAAAVSEICAAGVFACAAAVLLAGGIGVAGIGIAQLLGAAAGTLIVLLLNRLRPTFGFSLPILRQIRSYAFSTGAVGALTLVFANVGTIAVAVTSDGTTLGVWLLALNLCVVPGLTLALILGKVVFPVLTESHRHGDISRFRSMVRQSIVLATTAGAAYLLLYLVIVPPWIVPIFGESYRPAEGLVQWLVLYGTVLIVSAPIASASRAMGRADTVARVLLAQTVVAVVGLSVLAPIAGAGGAAIAMGAAATLGALGLLVASASPEVETRSVALATWAAIRHLWITAPLALVAVLEAPRAVELGVAVLTIPMYGLAVGVTELTSTRGRLRIDPRWASVVRLLIATVVCSLLAGVGLSFVDPRIVIAIVAVTALTGFMTRYLREGVLIALVLVAVLPIHLFVAVSDQLPLITLSRVIVFTALFAGLINVLLGRLTLRLWQIWLAATLWLLVATASTLTSLDISVSALRLGSDITEGLLFAYLVYLVFDRSTYRWAVAALVVAACLNSGFALFELSGTNLLSALTDRANDFARSEDVLVSSGDDRLGVQRLQGTFQHPAFLGSSLAIVVPLIYALALSARSGRDRLALGAALAVCSSALILSGTRATWLAAAFGIAVVMLAAVRRHTRVISHLGLIVAVVGALILVAPKFWHDFGRLLSDLANTSGSTNTQTSGYRLFLAEEVLEESKREPVLGHGPGTFDRVGISGYYNGLTVELRSPDSHPARLLIETGWAGLSSFAFLMIAVGYFAIRAVRERSFGEPERLLLLAALAGAAGFIFVNTTISAFAIPQVAICFWVLMALVMAAPRRESANQRHDLPIAAFIAWGRESRDRRARQAQLGW